MFGSSSHPRTPSLMALMVTWVQNNTADAAGLAVAAADLVSRSDGAGPYLGCAPSGIGFHWRPCRFPFIEGRDLVCGG
jgi:hypothetical protein